MPCPNEQIRAAEERFDRLIALRRDDDGISLDLLVDLSHGLDDAAFEQFVQNAAGRWIAPACNVHSARRVALS